MTLHDLAVPGDVAGDTSRISGSVRIYVPGAGTILLADAGQTVLDETTGTVLGQSGQHPFEAYFGHGDLSALEALCGALE
ncbi:MAG: hypothetical protein M3P14_04925 [Chloroflexota bacterium]|nr:hypothetical protein [Chloroflexota bacterium]